MQRLSAFACAAAGLALALAGPATAATFMHTQTTTDKEKVAQIPNPGLNYRTETFELTVKNSTNVDWTDYHFYFVIPDGAGLPTDYVEITKLTVPAPPFESGSRSKSPGSSRFDVATFRDGQVSEGGSFTATIEAKYGTSIDIYGKPSFAEAPEPAAWTLTIAGFGLAGARLRRRWAASRATS